MTPPDLTRRLAARKLAAARSPATLRLPPLYHAICDIEADLCAR